jgi:hypothetical protein
VCVCVRVSMPLSSSSCLCRTPILCAWLCACKQPLLPSRGCQNTALLLVLSGAVPLCLLAPAVLRPVVPVSRRRLCAYTRVRGLPGRASEQTAGCVCPRRSCAWLAQTLTQGRACNQRHPTTRCAAGARTRVLCVCVCTCVCVEQQLLRKRARCHPPCLRIHACCTSSRRDALDVRWCGLCVSSGRVLAQRLCNTDVMAAAVPRSRCVSVCLCVWRRCFQCRCAGCRVVGCLAVTACMLCKLHVLPCAGRTCVHVGHGCEVVPLLCRHRPA